MKPKPTNPLENAAVGLLRAHKIRNSRNIYIDSYRMNESEPVLTPQEKVIKELKRKLEVTENILDVVLAEKYKRRRAKKTTTPTPAGTIIHTASCYTIPKY